MGTQRSRLHLTQQQGRPTEGVGDVPLGKVVHFQSNSARRMLPATALPLLAAVAVPVAVPAAEAAGRLAEPAQHLDAGRGV